MVSRLQPTSAHKRCQIGFERVARTGARRVLEVDRSPGKIKVPSEQLGLAEKYGVAINHDQGRGRAVLRSPGRAVNAVGGAIIRAASIEWQVYITHVQLGQAPLGDGFNAEPPRGDCNDFRVFVLPCERTDALDQQERLIADQVVFDAKDKRDGFLQSPGLALLRPVRRKNTDLADASSRRRRIWRSHKFSLTDDPERTSIP
jgi:hypothetical protein